MSSMSKVSFSKGDYIFFEGDVEAHFYIIESGQVKIFTKNSKGEKIELATLSDGETFGEFALIGEGHRTASAQAATDVKLMKVNEQGYKVMIESLPPWASSMMENLIARLKNMNQNLKK